MALFMRERAANGERNPQNFMCLDAAARALGVSRRTLNYWLVTPGLWSPYLKPVWRVSYKLVLLPRRGVTELAALRQQLNHGGKS